MTSLTVTVAGAPSRVLDPRLPALVGRDFTSTVAIGDASVAPRHLDLRASVHGWVLTDLGTQGGTWIGGRPVTGPVLVDRPVQVVLGHPGQTGVAIWLQPQVAPFAPFAPPASGSHRGALAGVLVALVVLVLGVGGAVALSASDESSMAAAGGPAAGADGPAADAPEGPAEPDVRPGYQRVPEVPPAVAPSDPHRYEGYYDGNEAGDGVPELLTAFVEDIEAYWTDVARASGLPDPEVETVWLAEGEAPPAACQEAGDDPDLAAYYCPREDTIVIAIPFAVYTWNGQIIANDDDHSGEAAGDLSLGATVAHEYAHAIQTEWSAVRVDRVERPVIATELHADCWAGVWVNAALRSGAIDEADAQEAIDDAARVGDYLTDDPGHHGTPDQRVAAFTTGYTSGAPAACNPLLDTPAAG